MSDKRKDNEDFEEDAIEKLLKKIAELPPVEDHKASKNLHAETIASTLEQYMSPFIVIGYDINGDSIVIDSSKTQKDNDAIISAIGKYIMHFNKNMNGLGGDIGDLM